MKLKIKFKNYTRTLYATLLRTQFRTYLILGVTWNKPLTDRAMFDILCCCYNPMCPRHIVETVGALWRCASYKCFLFYCEHKDPTKDVICKLKVTFHFWCNGRRLITAGHLCHEEPQRRVDIILPLSWHGLLHGQPRPTERLLAQVPQRKRFFCLWYIQY